MTIRFIAVLLLAVTGGQLSAQGLDKQFTAATEAFNFAAGGAPEEIAALQIEILSSAEGTWFPADPISDGGALPEDVVARVCADHAITFTLNDPLSFTLSRQDGALQTRYDYAGGHTYIYSTPTEQVQAYLRIEERPLTDMLALSTLQSGAWRGSTAVFRPSPDILVLARAGWPVAIFGRCP
ncbi:hypothetical protein [Pelagovum pacificum]|uniref:Uncharacterized protein n=1 Tax=Pelagovum pacificum TaxID=2588711 RepID=A0A5C5GHS7_9RHOB|nr:hypothetical protein [Pelagovum pacificum]QQA43192.1 hypothetical protein I8N54_01065 [Pelagovum pacificum]TNY33667.1 hypothetical protein FHY64_10455 [Pelagovum pacificum]